MVGTVVVSPCETVLILSLQARGASQRGSGALGPRPARNARASKHADNAKGRPDRDSHDKLVLEQVCKHPPVDADASGRKELLAELAREVVDLELCGSITPRRKSSSTSARRSEAIPRERATHHGRRIDVGDDDEVELVEEGFLEEEGRVGFGRDGHARVERLYPWCRDFDALCESDSSEQAFPLLRRRETQGATRNAPSCRPRPPSQSSLSRGPPLAGLPHPAASTVQHPPTRHS